MKLKFTLFYPVFVLFSAASLSAQVERVVYQSLIVSDSTMQIEFDISDPHEVIPWHHESKVMVEVTTKLDGCGTEVIAILIGEGRYNVVLNDLYPVTTMRYVSPYRSLVKNGRGELCNETVTMRIYIPEGFIVKKTTDPKIPVEHPTAAKSEKRQ